MANTKGTGTTTKRHLVERVSARHSTVTKIQAQEVVQTFLEEIVTALARGERIELRDFGVFTPRTRKERKARNPKTGVEVKVPETKTVVFKLGKEFKGRLAGTPAAKA